MGVQTSTNYTRVVGGGDLGLGVVKLHGHPLVCSIMMGDAEVNFASSQWHPPTMVC